MLRAGARRAEPACAAGHGGSARRTGFGSLAPERGGRAAAPLCFCGVWRRALGRSFARYNPQAAASILSMEVDLMKVTRRELLKGAAAVGIAGALPQALPPSVHAQTTQKRELVVAQGGDISKFDPHFSTSSHDIRVSFNLFDNLVSRHPDGKLHPGLATEWKLHGQTQWTFKVRPGVKWHNGDPFTAADAK